MTCVSLASDMWLETGASKSSSKFYRSMAMPFRSKTLLLMWSFCSAHDQHADSVSVCVQYLDHTVVPVLRAALKELVMKRYTLLALMQQ